MYCRFILFVGLVISEVNLQSIEKKIQIYFGCGSNRMFRQQWDNHRKPLENAITLALKDSVGLGGMNVLIRKKMEEFAKGYYHNDNQVRLILEDLTLSNLPQCTMLEVQFSLASNMIKISSSINKMAIIAEYSVIRNKSDIVYDTKDQNPFEKSPFLFQQVHDAGELTIAIEGCHLLGFVLTTLNGESINLGYHDLKIINCQYTLEIYVPDAGGPPVIAKYALNADSGSLDITRLLMKPIEDDFVPKLQSAMFSLVNTSSVFHDDLQNFVQYQNNIFYATSQYLTEVVRNLNKITIEKNKGEVELKEYQEFWDDFAPDGSNNKGETITLSNIVVTGLDTLYSAHIGGPYKLTIPMIGEEIRFSSLQVRGHITLQSVRNYAVSDTYGFSAEISDVAVDLQLNVYSEPAKVSKVEVKGFRSTSITLYSVIFASANALIAGYLQAELPKVLQDHIKDNLPEALKLPQKKSSLGSIPSEQEKEPSESRNDVWSNDGLVAKPKSSESTEEELMRYEKRKVKKRFKSANRPRRSAHHHKGRLK